MPDMNLTLRISYDGGDAKAQVVGLDGSIVELGHDTEAAAAQTDVATEATQKFGKAVQESSRYTGGYVKQLILFGAAYKAIGEIKDTVTNFAQFQQSIADLSAITGATGQQLQYLSDQARTMGATTIYTASQAADAFKLVASAKPDLLSNSKALAEVTHQTLILAEAAGSTLPDAANSMASALNEFGAGADQASRFINVLAAGSKYGSSMIDQTSEALRVTGTVAHQVGLSFEQTNAAIQILGKNALYGSEAGTGLRGVLLRLETQSNSQFKPSVVGLAKAFENLAAAHLTATEASKLFGRYSIAAGLALVNNADQIQTMTDKVTGSSVALEQARIRTNTLVGDVKALTSAWQEQQLKLGDDITPALRDLVQGTTHLIQNTQEFTTVVDDASVALAAFAAKALIAKAGVTSLGEGFAAAGVAARGMVEALAPVALAVAVFETGRQAWEAWTAHQEKATAATRNSALAMHDYTKYLLPAAQRLNQLGISLNDINPRSLNDVLIAMQQLNQASRDAKDAAAAAGPGAWMPALPSIAPTLQVLQQVVVSHKKADQKVIAAEAQKYAQIDEMAKEAQANAIQRVVLKEDYELRNMAKERQRLRGMGNWTSSLQKQYEQARLDRALMTEDQLGKLEAQADLKRAQAKRKARLKELQEQQKFQRQMLGLQSNFNQLGQNATRVNIQAMTSELMSFAHAQVGFEKMTAKQKEAIVGGGLTALQGLMSSHNKTMFEIGKAAAMANAVVNTAEGVTKAWSLGPIEGPIMAGLVAAAGAAQIAAIASAKIGSSSASGAATPNYGGSGATPTVGVNPTTGVPTSSPTSNAPTSLTMNVHLNALDPSMVSDATINRIGQKLATVVQQNMNTNMSMAVQV